VKVLLLLSSLSSLLSLSLLLCCILIQPIKQYNCL